MSLRDLCSATLACGALLVGFRAHAQEPPPTRFEGALGVIVSNTSTYAGAAERRTKLLPGFYLRYGRLSVTNASGFVTRSNVDVERGLGLDLAHSEALRVNVALRFDGGRSESDSAGLIGLGGIRSTVRARAAATWRPVAQWRLGAAWSHDLLGHGGGGFGELGVAREQRASPSTTWTVGAAVSMAESRYMKSYFGVTPEQAARSGYAQFNAQAGLRDSSLFANVRSEIAPRWVALGGASFTHLLGSAAASPHTRQANSVAVNAGLAWLF